MYNNKLCIASANLAFTSVILQHTHNKGKEKKKNKYIKWYSLSMPPDTWSVILWSSTNFLPCLLRHYVFITKYDTCINVFFLKRTFLEFEIDKSQRPLSARMNLKDKKYTQWKCSSSSGHLCFKCTSHYMYF